MRHKHVCSDTWCVWQSNGSAKGTVTNHLNVRNDTSSGGTGNSNNNSKKNKNKDNNRDPNTPSRDDALNIIKWVLLLAGILVGLCTRGIFVSRRGAVSVTVDQHNYLHEGGGGGV